MLKLNRKYYTSIKKKLVTRREKYIMHADLVPMYMRRKCIDFYDKIYITKYKVIPNRLFESRWT